MVADDVAAAIHDLIHEEEIYASREGREFLRRALFDFAMCLGAHRYRNDNILRLVRAIEEGTI